MWQCSSLWARPQSLKERTFFYVFGKILVGWAKKKKPREVIGGLNKCNMGKNIKFIYLLDMSKSVLHHK